MKSYFHKFKKFLAVGALATISHYTVLVLCVELAHLPPLISSGMGFLCGAGIGFWLNSQWVFAYKDPKAKQVLQYLLMVLVGSMLNLSLVDIAIYKLGMHYFIAQCIATASIVILNFIFCQLLIFKRRTFNVSPKSLRE